MTKEIDKVMADIISKRDQLWKEVLSIGNTFWVRSRNDMEVAHLVTVTQISVNSKGSVVSIGLGTDVFPPEELIKNYEWSSKPPKDNDWQSFSIWLTF